MNDICVMAFHMPQNNHNNKNYEIYANIKIVFITTTATTARKYTEFSIPFTILKLVRFGNLNI